MHPRDPYVVTARVIEAVTPIVYRVELANGHRLMAHASGSMRMHFIQHLPGEKILLEISPYDLTRGRLLLPGQAASSSDKKS